MPLTRKQRDILTYLTEYQERHGFAPSFEEIAARFNYNSLATVHEHLTNLERKGYIRRAYNESRAIEILPSERQRFGEAVGKSLAMRQIFGLLEHAQELRLQIQG